MRDGLEPGRWVVFRYDLERVRSTMETELSDLARTALRGLEDRDDRKHWQPFLTSPSGRPDLRVNAFFSSRKMRSRSPLTWKKYAHSLGLWLNFLIVLGREWDTATEEDAEYFKEWRITEASNPEPVAASTFRGDLVALRAFYRWAASKHAVADPVAVMDDYDLMPNGPRQKDIKWLDPAGYDRWVDLGLRGLDVDGREDRSFRGRNEQRDATFADGLYGTGSGSRSGPASCSVSCPRTIPVEAMPPAGWRTDAPRAATATSTGRRAGRWWASWTTSKALGHGGGAPRAAGWPL